MCIRTKQFLGDVSLRCSSDGWCLDFLSGAVDNLGHSNLL